MFAFSIRGHRAQWEILEQSASTLVQCHHQLSRASILNALAHRRRIYSLAHHRIYCNLALHRKSIDLLYFFHQEVKLVVQTLHHQGSFYVTSLILQRKTLNFLLFLQSLGRFATWFIYATGGSYRHQRSRRQPVRRKASLTRKLRLKMQRLADSFNRSSQSMSVWGGWV